MSFKYPLATSSWGHEEIEAMQRVIASGMFTMGPNVEEFERNFAKYIGSHFCVMVNSGSSANLLMVAALFYTSNPKLRLKAGDEVIVPAVSWSTSYFPLHQYGLKIKFVDIDLHTLNFDLGQLELAVTDRTRVILAVNLLGNPNDFDRIASIIGEREIVLLEDNCESLGASFNGRKTATFGAMGTTSTFFSHHISTMEGGLVVTDDEELYHILLSLRAHGWTRNLPRVNHVTGTKRDDPFEESFHFVLPGYNLRPLELSGAVGIEQLNKLPEFVRVRRENAVRFMEIMADKPHFLTQREIGESSWFGFSLILKPGTQIDRRDLLLNLVERGIECRPIVAGNLVHHEVVRWFDFKVQGKLKNADLVHRNGFFVGNQHYSLDRELDLLGSALSEVFA